MHLFRDNSEWQTSIHHLLVPLLLDVPVDPDHVPGDDPGQEHQRHAVTDHHHGEEVFSRQLTSSEGTNSPTWKYYDYNLFGPFINYYIDIVTKIGWQLFQT